MNIQHSSRSDSWGTPQEICEMVHEVMGGIDLDPCSNSKWNATVRARHLLTAVDNGLSCDWYGRVFVNPPGGKVGNKSQTGLFWDRLVKQVRSGKVSEAIFMAFSVEALALTQQYEYSIMDFPFCVPAKRIRFVSDTVKKNQPSHSNAIVYLGPQVDRFRAVFSRIGKVVVP